MNFNLKKNFTKELPSDSIIENKRRLIYNACYSFVKPKKTSNPKIIHVSKEMLNELGISENISKSEDFVNIVTGNKVLESTQPYAMCYGGHQFGYWAGQLGDGRAINLFELEHNNKNWTIQLKGAGETPYSRRADGLAVLRSSIREYLCSEAMHHLGIPTTRALSLSLTGDQVLRDVLYDGNPAYEKGAIVSRVSPSFIRFGNFEILSANKDTKTLKTLTDFTMKHYFSHIGKPSKENYVKFFHEVASRTLEMIIHWQRVGFVHGVMNTDNMSILGLTIDYGPYGWLEGFDYGWTPNTTDREHKRYRFGNQIYNSLWNLYKFANAIFPLVGDPKPFEEILENYNKKAEEKNLQMMLSKIGIFKNHPSNKKLVDDLIELLHKTETDMTIFFRLISKFEKSKANQGFELIKEAFYNLNEAKNRKDIWLNWFIQYSLTLQNEELTDNDRANKMNLINPKYVLRNYMAQLAIEEAENEKYDLIDEFYHLLKNPYDEQPHNEKWFSKRPDWARNKIGCSMLSCSS